MDILYSIDSSAGRVFVFAHRWSARNCSQKPDFPPEAFFFFFSRPTSFSKNLE